VRAAAVVVAQQQVAADRVERLDAEQPVGLPLARVVGANGRLDTEEAVDEGLVRVRVRVRVRVGYRSRSRSRVRVRVRVRVRGGRRRPCLRARRRGRLACRR
tara:strand:- start:227 stop:532 length:306 start_codon:yes stop_codon:yes gene_type:complete